MSNKSPPAVLKALVTKIEDILVAKGVKVTVPLDTPYGDGMLGLRWLHTKRRLQIWLDDNRWENIGDLCDAAGEAAKHMPAEYVAAGICTLVPVALSEQETFEKSCRTGAALLATYLHEVGWDKRVDIINPVPAVEPGDA